MTDLRLRRNLARDLAPLERLLARKDDLGLVDPSARHPFDAEEWYQKWLNEADDESFYLVDDDDCEVGLFAVRVAVGPKVRHLAYVFVAEEMRGGTGGRLAELAEEAARDLGALSVTLKVDLDNPAAVKIYHSAGYMELSRRNGMATMRRDLD